MKYAASLTLLVLLCVSVGAEAKSITFDDLYNLPRAVDPQISPDGRLVAFVLIERDAANGTSESHIWVMNDDGSGQRQFTHGPGSEEHPRWSPDGTLLAFQSDRTAGEQVWVMPINGGEARAVTSLSTGASGMEWAQVGDRFLFVSTVWSDCQTDSCNQARSNAVDSNPLKARLYDKLLYRHYNAWDDGMVDQLFMGSLPGPGDSLTNVAPGPFDVPTSLLGGSLDYQFAPDGSEVCFVMSQDTNPAVCVNNNILIVPVGGGTPESVTESEGGETEPRYSPDGQYLAYLCQERACYEADQADIMLYDRQAGTHVNLTDEFDRSVGEYVWGPESRVVYFTAIDAGLSKVYQIDIKWKKIETVLDDAVYGYLAVSPDGKYLVMNRSLADEPYELFRFDLKKDKLTRMTFFTDPVVNNLDLSPAQDFWFTGFGGDSVHGYLTVPPYLEAGEKYPLVLLIHGGPQWCWRGDFNYYGWNTQLVAAQGYVVAQIDPHGSVGYGLAFKEYVSGNWGKGDYEDLMLGVDHLIRSYPCIDSTRMAALGRSYGGYMVNWMCGHTDRFDCLVSIDGPSNQVSGYGSTEELWFPEWEYGGPPWTNPEEYQRVSPINYASAFATPTLVIHGQHDYRVDLSEGLQMFTALQRQGVPSQLLYYPDEGHNAFKVRNLRFGYQVQFEWLRKWLK